MEGSSTKIQAFETSFVFYLIGSHPWEKTTLILVILNFRLI